MADDKQDDKNPETAADANTLIAGGLGIGAFGLISAAIGGAVCPVCVVAAPALLGVGAYKRWKARSVRR
ncbi:hypothetical protein BH11MYX4_BH11MYX4_05710 [soil metagenome]